MKKIVIASDSFKGSLSSEEVAAAVAEGVHNIYPDCETIKLAIGDGGEGTCRAIAGTLPCEWIKLQVKDPLGRMCSAEYAIYRDAEGSVAIIEMAQASGLILLDRNEYDPLRTSTYGTGQMIRDAAERGCRRFIIGLGGSATNDGGTGILEALGIIFKDAKDNTIVGCCGERLGDIAFADTSDMPQEILRSTFTAACDVDTPFYGDNGATRIFTPQKGGSESAIEILESGMQSFAEVVRRKYGIDLKQVKGSGAAGGTGGGLYAFLGAELRKGADMVLDLVGFDRLIEDADLVITGEGKIDSQTFCGKLPYSVMNRAVSKGIPVIAICGIADNETSGNEVLPVFPIQTRPVTAEELSIAMKPEIAASNITHTISSVLLDLPFK